MVTRKGPKLLERLIFANLKFSYSLSHTAAPLHNNVCVPVEFQHASFFSFRVEFVTITPDGFRYRSQIFPTVNGLFRWFKDHYQEPVPGMDTPYLSFIVLIVPFMLRVVN